MDLETIIVKREEGVTTVILNRPETLNALNTKMIDELSFTLSEIARQTDTKVVILTGSGRAFCSGGDIAELSGKHMQDVVDARDKVLSIGKNVVAKLMNLEKPVLVAVNGAAAGAGCCLALAGDIIIASENAYFSQSFVRLGLIPDSGGLYNLPRLVGIAKAKELCFTGDTINAKEAKDIGLVNKVVPHDQLESSTKEIALRLAYGFSRAIGFIKTIINKGFATNDLFTVLELEAQAQAILFQTEDFKKAVQGYLKKR